ncbi:hypothetical protein D3C87_120400 [compost metagenome]|jgi:hypothetical protein
MTSQKRRTILSALATTPLWGASSALWAQTTALKISHQFPGIATGLPDMLMGEK